MSSTTRGTILLEDAPILAHSHFDGDQHLLRLHAPRCAARAVAGSFVHLRCAAELPMRRPMSIMRVDREAGWIEVLYKVVGAGTRALRTQQPPASLSVLGPIGVGFSPHAARPRVLAIGGGVGIPPLVFLTEQLRARADAAWKPLVLMGSEVPFPFRVRPSTILVPGMPDEAIGCMPLLDEWGVPSRLASLAGYPGCFDGFVTELARRWLSTLRAAELAQTELFACGPMAMLRATATLAREFGVPCQVSLEEFMACAVGGCAGCAVPVRTPAGPAMKRVCVDGPVFDAAAVFPEPDSEPQPVPAAGGPAPIRS
ncbi:MAG TPA: dihydroorotate dehydrogenase electron transfer subunit [Steroidobacteraceae bacterium]|nr:dihydroorotate dehydrogenase electron transfer subunit [Steroidobacteraceae bacterium]